MCTNSFRQPLIASFAFLRIGVKRTIAYPLDILGMFLSAGTYAVIYLLVSTSDGKSLEVAIQYWLMAQIFFLSVRYPSTTLFTADQRLERLAILHTLPISHFSRLMGYQAGTRIIPVCIAVTMYLLFCPWETQAAVRLALLAPVIFISGFSLEIILGVSFLRSTKTFGIGELKLKLMLLLSGIIFELPSMPGVVQNFAYYTPFPWLVYEPSLYVLGNRTSCPIATLAWATALTAIAVYVSRRPTEAGI